MNNTKFIRYLPAKMKTHLLLDLPADPYEKIRQKFLDALNNDLISDSI